MRITWGLAGVAGRVGGALYSPLTYAVNLILSDKVNLIKKKTGTMKFSFNKKLLSVFLFLLLLPTSSLAFVVTPALRRQGPSVPRLPLRLPFSPPHRRASPPSSGTYLEREAGQCLALGPWWPAGAQRVERHHGEQAQARAPVCALTERLGQGLARAQG